MNFEMLPCTRCVACTDILKRKRVLFSNHKRRLKFFIDEYNNWALQQVKIEFTT